MLKDTAPPQKFGVGTSAPISVSAADNIVELFRPNLLLDCLGERFKGIIY